MSLAELDPVDTRRHMRLKREKLEVLRCFRFTEIGEAPRLQHLSSREQAGFLLWLDQSGLALYLLDRLRQANTAHCLPDYIARRLEDKLGQNRKRTGLLVEQLAEVVALLEARGIPYAVMKGFSLSPEFCPDPVLRHQTDIDLLLARKDVAGASAALESRGYSRLPSLFEEEFIFSTPLRETPSWRDNIYAPREKKVEIHLSFWDPICGIAIDAPQMNLSNVRVREVMGVKFCALPLEQALLLQLLHVFRHLLGGWIRPSWLYELAWFLDSPCATSDVCARMLNLIPSPNTAHACGLCLSMAATVFQGGIPSLLQEELIAGLPGADPGVGRALCGTLSAVRHFRNQAGASGGARFRHGPGRVENSSDAADVAVSQPSSPGNGTVRNRLALETSAP